MAGKAKYSWSTIENLYITGGDDVTFETLHQKYLPEVMDRVPAIGSIKRHSTEGDWWDKRKQYRANVQTETHKKVVEKEADIRANQMNMGNWLQGFALLSLKRVAKTLREDPNEVLSPYLALQILKEGISIERKAMGMPDLKIQNTGGNRAESEVIEILARTIGITTEEVTEILEDSPEE